MKSFYEPGFLLEVPPARESTDIKTFASVAGDREIIWNVDQVGFHILKLPDIETIQRIVAKKVAEILRIQWEETIVRSQPPPNTDSRGLRRKWISAQFGDAGAKGSFWALPVDERAALLRPYCLRAMHGGHSTSLG
jgi:hypothetical protein